MIIEPLINEHIIHQQKQHLVALFPFNKMLIHIILHHDNHVEDTNHNDYRITITTKHGVFQIMDSKPERKSRGKGAWVSEKIELQKS